MNHPVPLVSIVMPIRNEAHHVDRAFDAIDAQSYPRTQLEVLVVDGGSTDGTVEAVRARTYVDTRFRLLGGPGVNTPAAMQLGIEASRGDIVAKVDGHGWINERFIEAAIKALAGDSGVGCVGGIITPVVETDIEGAIALARFSRLGVGGGVYTLKEQVQDTDTVQCGVYRREALLAAGGFDPTLQFGEDEEANFRLRRSGWRIRLDPAMRFSYRVRPSIGALFRQYFRYGRARVAVVRRHPSFFRPKHAAPAALVLGLIGTPVSGLVVGWWLPTVVVWSAYSSLVVAGAILLAARARFGRPDLVGRSLLALHAGYGFGTLRGLLD